MAANSTLVVYRWAPVIPAAPFGILPTATGYYNPFWYGPFIHPGFYNGFAQQPDMGQLRLEAPAKGASVYVDGAYAGPAEKLKRFWLSPGVYNLEVRDNRQQSFQQRVYVLSGKTLAIRAELQPVAGGETK